ncbi:hypothetical protein ACHAWF_015015 [Thalassiosira exigua]
MSKRSKLTPPSTINFNGSATVTEAESVYIILPAIALAPSAHQGVATMLWLQFLLFLPLSAAFLPAAAPRARASSASRSRPSSARSASSSASPPSLRSSSSLRSAASSSDGDAPFSGFGSTGFLVLAGGTGSRMKANMPKQFLSLRSRPVLHYSLHLFLEKLPSYCAANGLSPPAQVVLVMDPKYQPEYQPIVDAYAGRLAFANPGVERQGSVENGLNKLVELTGGTCEYVAVHDSARPLVTVPEILDVCADAQSTGAAVLGVPCKATIKESEDGSTVLRTIPRTRLWEVHTPQVVRVEALLRGFEKVEKENLEVTDDVSIVEALGEPVRLTRGEYTNLKITTPEDMDVAGAILADRGEEEIALRGAGADDGGAGGSESDAALSAVLDLSSSPPQSKSKNNPFATTHAKKASEKDYNAMGGARMGDGYDNGRVYPQAPTPSRWQE